jgi:hypothetical protein
MKYKEHNMKYKERSISYVSFFLRDCFLCSGTVISLTSPSKEFSASLDLYEINKAIHHLDKPYQPLQLALNFHDNQNHHECVAVHENSLYTPPTMHLAFHLGTTYNRLVRPGEQGQMGRNYAVDARV